MNEMESRLRAAIAPLLPGGVALAFSGGCDSALLLTVLARMRAETPFPLLVAHFSGPFQTADELARAQAQAEREGVALTVLAANPLSVPEVRHNRRDRCYHCKRAIFSRLAAIAAAQGIAHLVDGTNADDAHDGRRPGLRALRELGVSSPLAAAGLSKAQVRELAAALGVPTAAAPAGACLATRFPYDTPLEEEALRRVEAAERFLREIAPGPLRARAHGLLARIEVDADAAERLLARRQEVSARLRALGFQFVTLDLDGFRSGAFDV